MTQEEIVKELDGIRDRYNKCAEVIKAETFEKFGFYDGSEYVYLVFVNEIDKLLTKIKQ